MASLQCLLQIPINILTPVIQVKKISYLVEHRKASRFNPYQLNYGTVVAVAGKDFVVVGGDTRLSEGYSIITRG